MMRQMIEQHPAEERRGRAHGANADWSLQVVLWTLWTFTVAGTAYLNWHADVLAQQPVELTRLIIRCLLAGAVGLVVMTVVEQRLEPWRFLD